MCKYLVDDTIRYKQAAVFINFYLVLKIDIKTGPKCYSSPAFSYLIACDM